jgi:flagellar biogenesis protein FliO
MVPNMLTNHDPILRSWPRACLGSGLLSAWLVCATMLLSAQEATSPAQGEGTKPEQAPPAADSAPGKPATQAPTAGTSEAWRKEMRELESQTQGEQGLGGREKSPSGWSMGFWLAFIVALAGAAIWATIRFRRRLAGKPDSNSMQIISRQAIDPKNSVVILRTRGRDYLLGVGPSGVSLLTLLPAPSPTEPEQKGGSAGETKPDGAKAHPAAN